MFYSIVFHSENTIHPFHHSHTAARVKRMAIYVLFVFLNMFVCLFVLYIIQGSTFRNTTIYMYMYTYM